MQHRQKIRRRRCKRQAKKYRKAAAARERLKSSVLISSPGSGKQTGIWVHPLIASHYAGWLNADFAVVVNETFLRVTIGNKRLAKLSEKHNRPHGKIHSDRAIGLFGKSIAQLRTDAGITNNDTPLNYMDETCLSYADAAASMVITADNPDLMALAAAKIAAVAFEITGKRLVPAFDEMRLTPRKARSIAYAPTNQLEIPT